MPQITGQPTSSGTYTFTLVAQDSAGNESNPTPFTIVVNGGALGLAVTTTSLNAGTSLSAYSFQLGAQGGSGGYTWALAAGSLAGSGITLSAGGLLSGATPVAGTYSGLVFRVTDSLAHSAVSAQLTLTIGSGTVPLLVSTTGLGAATAALPYAFQLTAQGGTTPYTWTLNSGSLSGSGITLAPSGLLSGANPSGGTYGPLVFKVTDNVSATALSATLTLNVNVPAPAMFPLPVVVELLINGTWTDVSRFVYQRADIHITGGRGARADKPSPATCTMTFDNRDGRFSPFNVNGPYYFLDAMGNQVGLGRNTQIRVSLNGATSSSGNIYSGYRFWGEVAEWPPASDVSGNDVYVSITANGPLRRINQGGGEGSALQRYYASLTGSFAPIAYWPCEEDPNAGQIGSGINGAANMVVTSVAQPKWKAVSAFNGSGPIGVVNGSTWSGTTASFGTSGDDLFADPGTWQWIATTNTVNVRCVGGGGGGTNGATQATNGGSAGGGGECSGNAALAVTPGNIYQVIVGSGGTSGTYFRGGGDGTLSSFQGDAFTVTARGGKGGSPNGGTGAGGGAGGTGGTGGTGGFHHPGGHGGTAPLAINAGGGGGGSGGTALSGNNGGNSVSGSPSVPGAGGAAVTGGGAGGGGGFGVPNTDGRAGRQPGGGGGGGWAGTVNFTQGAPGGAGAVELTYASTDQGTQPPANVIRFIMYVPKQGGKNNAAVLVRSLQTTGASIHRLDCQYRSGGNIRMFGYDGSNVQLFDSGNLSVNADGRTLMVSMELTPSSVVPGAVHWSLSALAPGSLGVGSQVVSGLLGGATMGSVSQILVDPNGDVTKTAIGHISVQYALIPLWKVSQALDGHQFEGGPDRFIRLAREQALGQIVQYNETVDHWGFEDGTLQGWTGAHGTLANSTFGVNTDPFSVWPQAGIHSLLLTADGTGAPKATSPTGLSGQPVQPGDVASLSVDFWAPAGAAQAYVGLQWYDNTGTLLPGGSGESDTADTTIPATQFTTLRLVGKAAVAPVNAAFCVPVVGSHATLTGGTQLYFDNVRLSPHMGPQTRKRYAEFLDEIADLEQGIVKEAKELWGLKLGTRISLISQSPAVRLDYAQKMLSPPLAPVLDSQRVKNHVIVHRHKGSSVEVTLSQGQMSIQEPPAGVGRFKRTLKAVAAADEQLAAMAQHLLNIGTASSERYPTVTVDLRQAAIPGNPLAPLMSAVAGVETGQMIEIDNLPFWYPSQTAKQMVIGYDEVINSNTWVITWNCDAYTPWIQVSTTLRRW